MRSLSVKELAPFVGRKGVYRAAAVGLDFEIEVLDARSSGYDLELQVRPMKGNGQCWMRLSEVKLGDE